MGAAKFAVNDRVTYAGWPGRVVNIGKPLKDGTRRFLVDPDQGAEVWVHENDLTPAAGQADPGCDPGRCRHPFGSHAPTCAAARPLAQVRTVAVFTQDGRLEATWDERAYSAGGALTQISEWPDDETRPSRVTPPAPVPLAGPWLMRQIITVTADALASEDPAAREAALVEIERLLGQRPGTAVHMVPLPAPLTRASGKPNRAGLAAIGRRFPDETVALALALYKMHSSARDGMTEALRMAGLFPGRTPEDGAVRVADALEAYRAGPEVEDFMRDALAAAQAAAWQSAPEEDQPWRGGGDGHGQSPQSQS